jgi:hypothetical protein
MSQPAWLSDLAGTLGKVPRQVVGARAMNTTSLDLFLSHRGICPCLNR